MLAASFDDPNAALEDRGDDEGEKISTIAEVTATNAKAKNWKKRGKSPKQRDSEKEAKPGTPPEDTENEKVRLGKHRYVFRAFSTGATYDFIIL